MTASRKTPDSPFDQDTGVPTLGEVKTVPVSKIKPARDNPRKIPTRAVEVVANSLREFGWQQPLVVDENHVIIAGHTRLLAAQSLKLTEVPVVVADGLSPDQVRAYRIADNRSGDFTSWDLPVLSQQLDALADEFSEVLALADWQIIVDDLEEAAAEHDIQMSDELKARANIGDEIRRTVTFASEEDADRAAVEIAEIEGVIDVRSPNRAG